MSILAEHQGLVQPAVSADEHGKVKDPLPPRPRGPHPYRVRGAARAGDAQARALLAGWFGEYAPMVEGVVARTVRHGDLGLVEDLAQDVWVEAWQYLLRGNTVARPVGLLARFARHRVTRHYASARVRRELLTDYQDDASAVARLALWIAGGGEARDADGGGLEGAALECALAEQRHQLEDPAIEAAFAGLAPSVAVGRCAA